MQYTSAEIGKKLKELENKINAIYVMEEKTAFFMAAMGENVEELRPQYDFTSTQGEIEALQEKVRKIKHELNLFNTTHTLPGFEDLTIDQALVYIPQLTMRIKTLRRMASSLPRERRDPLFRENIIDYRIANYNIEEAEKAYEDAKEELTKLQLALDAVNSSEKIELDIDL